MRKDRVIKTKEILIFVFAYENEGKKMKVSQHSMDWFKSYEPT